MAWKWELFNSSNPIDKDDLNAPKSLEVINLLKGTAKVHARDFVDTDEKQLRQIVKTIHNGANWIQLHCRTDESLATPKIDVVILYHLLKHRERTSAGRKRQWSVTVGLAAGVVPYPDANPARRGDPNDINNPYVILAKEIEGMISDFCLSQTPKITSIVWIDDVEKNPANAETLDERRAKPIGELTWTAENNRVLMHNWSSVSRSKVLRPTIPNDPNNTPIKGYGADDDTHIYVTEVNR